MTSCIIKIILLLFLLLTPTIACAYLGGIYTLLAILSLIPWLVAILWTWQAYRQWKNEKFEDDYV